MLAMAGLGGGIYALKRGLESIVRAAMEQEKAERALSAAIGTKSIAAFKAYAAEMQKLTIYGDEQIINQMAYAKNLGVTTDKLQEATTAAIGLAARFRIDLASAMMLVGRASQGQTQMLTRYGIIIDQTLSDTEKFNALLKIGAASFHLAEEEANTAEGTFTQFKKAVGDLAEVIGKPFLETMAKDARNLKTHIEGTTEAIEKFQEAAEKANEVVGRLKYMPMGIPFAPPQVPKDILKQPEATKKALTDEQIFFERVKPSVDDYIAKTEKTIADKKKVMEIAEKHMLILKREIDITGRVGESHWHAAKMVEFETEMKKANIETTEFIKVATEEYAKKLKELEKAQRLAAIAGTVGQSWAEAFERMVFEAGKAKDFILGALRDIAIAAMRENITKPFALALTEGVSGFIEAIFAHRGGIVGQIGQKRMIPALDFIGAPRLHGGLAPDEMPAIVQRGERILPKGAGMPAVNVIINNNTGMDIRQKGQPQYDGENLVVTLEAMLSDRIQRNAGPLRGTIMGLGRSR